MAARDAGFHAAAAAGLPRGPIHSAARVRPAQKAEPQVRGVWLDACCVVRAPFGDSAVPKSAAVIRPSQGIFVCRRGTWFV
jgi:hypothetical protein